MHRRPLTVCALMGALALLLSPIRASAQDSVYVAGTGFADIRQFGGTSSGTLPIDNFSPNGTGSGGSIRVGTWVHPRWTIEAGVDVGSETTTTFRGPVIAIFPPPSPINFKTSNSFVGVSTMVGFHSPAGGRVRLGYLAGFSFVQTKTTNEYPSSSLASFFLDDDFFGSASASFTSLIGGYTGLSTVGRSSLTLPSAAFTNKRNSGALILGFEAAIDVTSKLAVVPELRALTFSTTPSGPGVFLIRPGVGARWKF